jgi:hypothetical protein
VTHDDLQRLASEQADRVNAAVPDEVRVVLVLYAPDPARIGRGLVAVTALVDDHDAPGMVRTIMQRVTDSTPLGCG